jgi:hypothetical protein
MSNTSSVAARASRWIGALSFEKKLLLGVWLLFLILVAAGIHGSSTGASSASWAPERPYLGYLFKVGSGANDDSSGPASKGLQWFLMENASGVRSDEFGVYTPYALSQFAQNPRFPVINPSYGNGQNMLLIPEPPVLHIATLARPATWGYFLLGKQRGLAWFWWFQVFGCFTVLFLLFQLILKGHVRLAAFGAFWFCASAYTVCWSNWPDHATLFAGLGCLAAYYILASQKKSTQIVCGILLGVSVPAFVMFMYPAWQVQLGYFAVVVFASLVIRDKLYVSARVLSGSQLLGFGLAAILAGGLMLSWLITCLPDLRIISNTVYPGSRISVGGHYSLAEFFKGTYNLVTIYNYSEQLLNQSEASSFYYLFPAILLAVPFSKRLRGRLGAVGWAMLGYILVMLFFLFVGIPASVAKLSLLSYIPAYRADLTIGLASIVLCLIVLACAKESGVVKESASAKESGFNGAEYKPQVLPLIVSGVIVLLFIFHGLALLKFTGDLPNPPLILFMALLMGSLSYDLLAGRKTVFCAVAGLLVVATTSMFNPLATNLDHIYDSELARKIVEIDSQSEARPLWVCYGGVHVGALISILGGRSLTGIQWEPQLAIWHALDPDRLHEQAYNSYNEVSFFPSTDDNQVLFDSPKPGLLWVRVSPNNPTLRSLGVRYVVQWRDAQNNFDTSKLRLVYRSLYGTFSIFEIPQ